MTGVQVNYLHVVTDKRRFGLFPDPLLCAILNAFNYFFKEASSWQDGVK